MNRRRWVYGAVAGAAAATGLGLAWWARRPVAPAAAGGDPAFWGAQLDTPSGAPLALASLRGKPLLLNFWATWCPPCIEELPLIESFYQQNKGRGWQVLAIAIDQPSAVRQWLQRSPLSFAVALGGLEGSDMSKRLGNANGGLPFSVAFSAQGEVSARKLGQLSAADLQRWAELT
ncbi:MAG: TlpA disulfide reductase family protein [Betaproteobacteria bacterium]